MNGKKKKNKKLVLDSGKVTHYLRGNFGIKSFLYEEIFYFQILIFIISHFCRKKLKKNEPQIGDSFQI